MRKHHARIDAEVARSIRFDEGAAMAVRDDVFIEVRQQEMRAAHSIECRRLGQHVLVAEGGGRGRSP